MIGLCKGNECTKERLIEAGGEVFADHGFRGATVREICRRARAPLGSVNYHFRDKMGLYTAVLEHSFRQAFQKYPPGMGVSPDDPPEERLRAFIRAFLLRFMAEGFPAWHGMLMAHELAQPTGALTLVAETRIRPVYEHLAGIVKELLGLPEKTEEDAPVLLCATSVVGQCLYYYIGRQIIERVEPRGLALLSVETLADHVARFSLGGIRALAGKEIR
ncbi:MAG: CerR family C-terminal domain-containing protein [Thermodesulfobacteriota bacterium]